MTDHHDQSRTEARVERGRWPGIVWAIPLAALLIVAWLGLRALTDRGFDVELVTTGAQGVRTGDTHVEYNGLEIGNVSKIALADDNRHIVLTLRIRHDSAGLFRQGSRMWVLGADPSFTNIASLRAAVAGPSIGIDPGGGAPQRRFVASRDPPVIGNAVAGRHFRLVAPDLVSITPGTSIYTHGVQVGTVASIHPTGTSGFAVDAFIRAPFGDLVTRTSHFWDASAFQITRTAGGLQARLTSPSIAALGGISFETPKLAIDRRVAPAGSTFRLYPDSGSAAAASVGPDTYYQVALGGDVGGLLTGAPVLLRGFTVGHVADIRFVFDEGAGAIRTPVTIALDGVKLHIAPTRAAVDEAIDRLAAHGLRVKLAQSPPLIGGYQVVLDPEGGAPTRLVPGSPYPWLPAAQDAGDLLGKVDHILGKVDALPLAAIGANVRAVTANLRMLTGSPELKDSLNHLDRTLATVDKATQQAAPKIGPTLDALQKAAASAQQAAASASQVLGGDGGTQDSDVRSALRQLTEAARSIRSLTDYLSRHPEALLRGKKERR